MIDLIVAAIVVYIFYKFVFNFLLPIYRTTKMVKQKVGEMNNFHNQQTSDTSNTNPSYQQETRKETSTEQSKVGEYIDFEEIKD
ncbi:DUF4834 family protein [Rhizosphaericola mali]|uniref:DUF4834 family protein n=1 Tax=Rhizosphaericola mali TaxID=2545455 RepID=A0A5P2G3I0_9BACT|nr:DUF4834 family protein [Rhizosphaericola mali]QES89757.1 DUF4834 family protein [Rhizosphaericola mali]